MVDFKDIDLFKDEPFNTADRWSTSLAYLAFHPKFTNDVTYAGQYLSFLPALSDESLSDAADQLKTRTYSVVNTLQVLKGTNPLSVVVTAGGVRKQDGTPLTKASVTLTVSDNSISYIFVDSQGNIQA